MKLTPKTALLSIIAAPFAIINLFLIVALPISIVEAVQNPKTASNVSVTPSIAPTPIAKPSVTPRKPIKSYADEYAPEYKAPASEQEPDKDTASNNPEKWTSSRPNAMISGITEVMSMDGEHKYATLYRGQHIRLTGEREGNKVEIECDYGLFKTSGYVYIANVKKINLLDETP